MHPKKITCTPIYIEPQDMKNAAFEALKALRLCRQWVDNSTLLLNKDGSFSHKAIKEGSFKVRIQKASFSLGILLSSSRYKTLPEERRLHIGGRQLLISLLAHAWLWGRPKVLDKEGNLVAFEKRQVLAPQAILDFLSKATYTYQEIWKFLAEIKTVPLHKDTSKWNLIGVIACLRWDRSHNQPHGGPWCCCRLEKYSFPPPYYEVCPTKSLNIGAAGRFRNWLLYGNIKKGRRAGYKAEMAKE